MKNQFFVFLFAISMASFMACDKNNAGPREQAGSEALVAWEECVDFTDHGLTVCFEDVLEYRCPCNVDCIWEGAVDISLHITGQNIDTLITLSANSNSENLVNSAQIGANTIKIENPLPSACNDFGDLDKYKVTVKVL